MTPARTVAEADLVISSLLLYHSRYIQKTWSVLRSKNKLIKQKKIKRSNKIVIKVESKRITQGNK